MMRDLIVFGEDWGGLPSSTQHLVRHLARDRRVLWVNSIGMRRPRLTARDLGRLGHKVRAMLTGAGHAGPAAVPPPFPVVAPRALPWPGNPLARAFNRRVLGGQIARAAAAHGLRDPVLWTSLPTAVEVVGRLGEHAVVYFCGDDFGALAGVDHAPVLRMERELVDSADLIFVVSQPLADRFPSAKTHILQQGVDFDLFSTPVAPAPDLPRGGPVAGFFGMIEDWVDTDLLAEVARCRPAWQFFLIGTVKTDVSALAALSNVTLAGPRPYQSLPSYCQHWSVSLLPFRDGDTMRAANPLKLREYLAAGQPVVSTDFPWLDDYRDLVAVATGPAGYAAALESALREPAGRCKPRRERVAAESWPTRAAQAAALIDALG
ncbi:MAG TPA: glycosyltransferase [Lamprocystis sp. (in: g-proteobacteria)]|nr:glycosyltransferase [Lamprocystis sp. (in: g-proteobacteria)]